MGVNAVFASMPLLPVSWEVPTWVPAAEVAMFAAVKYRDWSLVLVVSIPNRESRPVVGGVALFPVGLKKMIPKEEPAVVALRLRLTVSGDATEGRKVFALVSPSARVVSTI